MSLSSEELTVIGTLGGAIVGALSSTIVSIVNKRSEEKRHFRETVINAAIENWKHVSQISSSQYLMPLEHYIIHTAKMCDLALNEKLTNCNIKEKLSEIDELMDALEDHAKKAK